MNNVPNHYLPDPFVKGRFYMHEDGQSALYAMEMDTTFAVHTEAGLVQARSGDYLCKASEDDLWPVKREIFLATYRPADRKVSLPPPAAISENDPER